MLRIIALLLCAASTGADYVVDWRVPVASPSSQPLQRPKLDSVDLEAGEGLVADDETTAPAVKRCNLGWIVALNVVLAATQILVPSPASRAGRARTN